jgi:hypothetical protein
MTGEAYFNHLLSAQFLLTIQARQIITKKNLL